MPRYDFKCDGCKKITIDVVCSYEQSLVRQCECGEMLTKFYGNYSIEDRSNVNTVGDKIKDLMVKDSWARHHIMPEEFFREQTEEKKKAGDQRSKDEAVKQGRLKEINQRRKALGLSEW